MADNVIGIKFGVAGGKGFLAGSSGALIKEQLEYIASRIKLKVNINKTYFRNQLASLKKELDKTLGDLNIRVRAEVKPTGSGAGSSDGGDTSQQVASYDSVTKALGRLYQAKAKLLKMPTIKNADGETQYASVAGAKTNNDVTVLTEELRKQLEELEKAEGVDKNRVQAIKDYRDALEQAYQLQQKSTDEAQKQSQLASPTATAKLQTKAASLYTDNGFDKVIARSKEAKGLVDSFSEAVNAALNQEGGVTKNQVEALNTQFLQTTARLKEIERETDTVGNKIKEAFNSRFIQRIAQILLLAILRVLKQIYDNVKKIDTAMTELKIVTNATANQMEAAANKIASAAKKIGASISDLTSSTTVYARLGYSLSDAQTLAEKTTIYANVAGVNVSEATTNITGIIKAFNIGADGLEAVLDQLIYVGNNFAISQAEIGEAMNNAASALVANGNTLQEAIGIITAANTSLQNVSKSSTAVRTVAARIARSTAELEELGEDAGSIMATADLANAMSAYGVAITDANGELRSTYDILNDLSKVWDDLDSTSQAAIANMLAGTRQQNAFYSIMQNWEDAQQVVEDSVKSTGALASAQAKYLDSIEGKVTQLTAAWEEFSTNILDSDLVKFFVDALKEIVNALDAITSLGDGMVVKFAVVTAVAVGLVSLINKLKAAILSFTGTTTLSLNVIGAAIQKFMAKATPILILSTIVTLLTSLSGKAQGAAELIVGVIAFIATSVVLYLHFVDEEIKLFESSNPLGWILLAITAIIAVIKGIVDLIKACNPSYEDLKEAAQECIDAWKEAEEELDNIKEKIQEVEEEIENLNSLDSLTLTEQADLERLQQELEILQQQAAVQEELTRRSQNDAINSTAEALDKLAKNNESAIKELKNGTVSDDILEALNEYSDLLSNFEYGTSEYLNSYFDEYYELLDRYTIATDGATAAWSSILSRVKHQDAVEALKDFADTFTDTSKITGDALKDLAAENKEVQKLFDYLQTVGMWDGSNWDDLTGLIGNLRTKLTELTAVSITDDIEALTDKFDSLSSALKDVAKYGVLSLDTLQTLIEKYPTLLNKYFDKTLDGYQLSSEYAGMTDYEIMQVMAVTDLTTYQEQLKAAKETLAGLTEADDDYETALKNVAIAQDNLNTKEIEWATILRESAISDETELLEKLQDALEDQLDIYKDLIDIRKDLLKTYQEEVDYQKTLAQKQKTVADLQTQLALAKLDKSAAGQAKVRELESQLQEAQDALDEYTLERAIDDITNALDNEYNEYEKFIKAEVDRISEQIDSIITTLDGILSGIEGLSSTTYTGTEMYDLYSELKAKQADGMSVTGNAASFMSAVASGDYNTADQYYASAKEAADSYEMSSSEPEMSEDEIKAAKMTKVTGAWGKGIAKNNAGDNGTVTFGGTEYEVESAGDDTSLYKAAREVNSYGDRDIFVYDGYLYGCLDNSIVKLRARNGKYSDSGQKGYSALRSAIASAGFGDLNTYHTGGFVGDISDLRSNEEFAKLLKGEFVSTPAQMDAFMKTILPEMLTYNGGNGATINNNSPLIEIKCGDIDEDALPKLRDLVNQAVTKIEKNMESALSRTGYKKKH